MFGLLTLLFYREVANIIKRVLFSGTIIGFLYFITMAFEMMALKQADSSLVSLLENCAIIANTGIIRILAKLSFTDSGFI